MKVSITHTEKSTGLLRRRILHCVSIHVTFSEEERSIIEQRNLKYDVVLERGHSADISDKQARKQEKRGLGRRIVTAAIHGADANSTNLTINKLMRGPDLYFFATPLEAKEYEDELKKRLVQLKSYIDGNAEVTDKSSTFEL